MMPTYQTTQQMKPQHVMQNVRPTGVPGRPGVQYPNQSIQPQPTPQQQQGQPSQMSVGYMNDQASMMMTLQGANSIPPNVNRQPGATASVKRKLADTTMYSSEQPQYATPPKMALQSTGKILINTKKNSSFYFSWSNATISTKSCNDATK
jgi:hypothetical protein